MNKINVLHLIQYGKTGGGVNKTLTTQLNAMQEERFQFYAIVAESGPLVDEIAPYFSDLAIIPVPPSILYRRREDIQAGFQNVLDFFRLIPFFRKSVQFIRAHDIQIIHSHNLKTNFFCIVLAKLCGISSICHIRSATPLGTMGNIYEWGATKIVSVSSGAQQASFRKISRPDKHIVIYNGRNFNEFYPVNQIAKEQLRKEFGFTPVHTVFGIVGSLIRWKGHITFIHAARQVLQKHPNARFLIVGDIDYESPTYLDEMKTLVTTLQLDEEITFTGFRKDVHRIYNIIDVLVSASWFEALGGVMIEAMACGCPVIGTNSGGTPEIVENNHTGLLIPVEDVPALTEAMVELIQDSTMRDAMGHASVIQVRQKFSVDRYIKDVQNLYLQLVAT